MLASRRVRPQALTCYRFDVKLVVAALAFGLCLPAIYAASNTGWTLVRTSHFEVYSRAGERDGRSALLWFEQLRAFFVRAGITQAGGDLASHGPVRVIGFQSAKEYAAFRPSATADAFFLSSETRDYIVMPGLGSEEFAPAAHEYAHLALRLLGVRLPPWLAEGIAEFFSTVHIAERECVIGGDLPIRKLALRRRPWIPLAQLVELTENSPIRADRNQADIFYAESWALTDMLIFSPAYAPRFSELLAEMASGASDAETIARIYGKPLSGIMADLYAWEQTPRSGLPLPGIPNVSQDVQVSQLTGFESRFVLADLLLTNGDLNRAEGMYRTLANEQPDSAPALVALGNIAFRKGDRQTAREEWRLAMAQGIRDARLCYEYSILAEDAGLPADEVGAALRRAIELKPDFDDARYKLALLENNHGHYESAVQQLRAMRSVGAKRAYGYWTAMASALTEMDHREEAKQAAAMALHYATSAEERASAKRLAYVAATDLTVQFSRDGNGNLQLITARKPHGSGDWNPFIEPGDHIQYVEGQIRKVECSAGKITGFRVESASGAIEVSLPDPTHVLIRGGTPEFVCGAEDGRKVAIEYATSGKQGATDGILRGMQFR